MGLASESRWLEHDVPARLLEVYVNCKAWSLIELEEGYWLTWPQGSGVLHPLGFPLAVILGSELMERLRHLKSLEVVRHEYQTTSNRVGSTD
jgi:hypothetical protein